MDTDRSSCTGNKVVCSSGVGKTPNRRVKNKLGRKRKLPAFNLLPFWEGGLLLWKPGKRRGLWRSSRKFKDEALVHRIISRSAASRVLNKTTTNRLVIYTSVLPVIASMRVTLLVEWVRWGRLRRYGYQNIPTTDVEMTRYITMLSVGNTKLIKATANVIYN